MTTIEGDLICYSAAEPSAPPADVVLSHVCDEYSEEQTELIDHYYETMNEHNQHAEEHEHHVVVSKQQAEYHEQCAEKYRRIATEHYHYAELLRQLIKNA